MDETVENFTEQDVIEEAVDASSDKHGRDDDQAVVGSEKRWPGWPGESVFRILIPAQKVGGIIGRKGEYIKKMCEESRARIKILDGPPGAPERAVSFFVEWIFIFFYKTKYQHNLAIFFS